MEKQTKIELNEIENTQQPEDLGEKQVETLENSSKKKKGFFRIVFLFIFLITLITVGYLIYKPYLSNKETSIQESNTQESLVEEVKYISKTPSIESEITSEYNDLLEKVETILADLNGLPIVKTDSDSMWWVSDDGFSILNDGAIAITTGVGCSNSTYEEGLEIVQEMKEKFGPAIDQLMINEGYKVSENNTSSSYSDDSFYDYIQGYENGDSKCLLTIDPGCSGSVSKRMGYELRFSCTSDFDDNYAAQAPILKDLELFNAVISRVKEHGDFLRANVNFRRTGHYIIAKKINGKWVEVHGGHDDPTCDTVDQYEIPNEFVSNCWDVELNEMRENKIGL